eukprot:g5149.t1
MEGAAVPPLSAPSVPPQFAGEAAALAASVRRARPDALVVYDTVYGADEEPVAVRASQLDDAALLEAGGFLQPAKARP